MKLIRAGPSAQCEPRPQDRAYPFLEPRAQAGADPCAAVLHEHSSHLVSARGAWYNPDEMLNARQGVLKCGRHTPIIPIGTQGVEDIIAQLTMENDHSHLTGQ